MLVAEAEHALEPLEALLIVVGTGVVLFLAHTYVAVVSERMLTQRRLGPSERREVLLDNVPVVIAVVGPSLLFITAELGAIDVERAFQWAIAFSLVVLYGIGLLEWRRIGYTWPTSMLLALGGTLIGGVIIAIEALH